MMLLAIDPSLTATPLEYILYGEPRAWQRAGSTSGRRFTPKAVAAEQRRHKEAASLSRPNDWPSSARYVVTIAAFLGTRRRPDVDNLAKLVLDAIQGVAFDNDSDVVRLVVTREHDPAEPRTEVHITWEAA